MKKFMTVIAIISIFPLLISMFLCYCYCSFRSSLRGHFAQYEEKLEECNDFLISQSCCEETRFIMTWEGNELCSITRFCDNHPQYDLDLDSDQLDEWEEVSRVNVRGLEFLKVNKDMVSYTDFGGFDFFVFIRDNKNTRRIIRELKKEIPYNGCKEYKLSDDWYQFRN